MSPSTSRNSKRLVVDTDVTSAASDSIDITSTNCRMFLRVILDSYHKVVFTPEIQDEWNRHRSKWSQRWLTAMYARRLVYRIDSAENERLRARLESYADDETKREEMLKDTHLLEAAIATDKIIASRNERERLRFAAACDVITEIRDILWANPDRPIEACLDWLQAGAPHEPKRTLGFPR